MGRAHFQSWPRRFPVRVAFSLLMLTACAGQDAASPQAGVPVEEYIRVWRECEREAQLAFESFQGQADYNALMLNCMKERGYGDYVYKATVVSVDGKAPPRYRRVYGQ